MLNKAGRWLRSGFGYLLYGMGVLVLLLWLLFPKEAIQRYGEGMLRRAYPELRWQVGRVLVEFPADVILRGIEGHGAGAEERSLVRIDELTLRPRMIESLRTGSVQVGYRALVGRGSVSGSVRLAGRQAGVQGEGTIVDVRVQDVPLLSLQLGRALQGSVSGTFTVDLPSTPDAGAALEAQLQVEKGLLGLKRPILGHAEFPFSRGTVVLQGSGDTLLFKQGAVESELFDTWFSGKMNVRRDLNLCRVEVKGTMRPKNSFFKGLDNTVALQALRMQLKENALPYSITGELSNPGIHFAEFAMLVQTLEKELQ